MNPAPCALPSPAYTQTTDVKAIGRRSNRIKNRRTSAPLATLALFLRPCFSMAGCVGQPSWLAGSCSRYCYPHASRRPPRSKGSDGVPS